MGTSSGPAFGQYKEFDTFTNDGQFFPRSSGSYSFESFTPFNAITGTSSASNFELEVLLVGAVDTLLSEELEAPWSFDVSWKLEASCACHIAGKKLCVQLTVNICACSAACAFCPARFAQKQSQFMRTLADLPATVSDLAIDITTRV